MKIAFVALLYLASVHGNANAADNKYKEFYACREKIKLAVKTDVLVDFDINQRPIEVIVGPTFHRIDITAKRGFADTANCLFNADKIGKNRICYDFNLIDSMSGKEVGKYIDCKLKML